MADTLAQGVAAHLLILGDREGLSWVLAHRRMAFPQIRAPAAQGLEVGDDLLLYTSRGCFRNPGRDRGRVIGLAKVASPVRVTDPPIQIAGRVLPLTCDLELDSLAPRGKGVELAGLVDRLEVFPDSSSWSVWMRRPLLRLPAADARVLIAQLTFLAGAPGSALQTYD